MKKEYLRSVIYPTVPAVLRIRSLFITTRNDPEKGKKWLSFSLSSLPFPSPPPPLLFPFLLSSPNFCQAQLERNERSCHLLDNSDLSCLFNKPCNSDTFLFCLFTFHILLVNKHVVMAGKNLIFQPVAGFEIKFLVISLAFFYHLNLPETFIYFWKPGSIFSGYFLV